ncbi:MAG: DUF1559 domain-containing protein [Gemmataceae bacterium]|nr:DUF1559 domain-containing protein [Gemmataceae bacterium]
MDRHPARNSGFTLVEVVVALGVLGLLVSLLLPAVQRARGAASRTRCANHLRQLALAAHAYEATNQSLPPRKTNQPQVPERLLSWQALLLPHLDQGGMWVEAEQACRVNGNPVLNPPHVGYATPLPVLTCPDDSRLLSPQLTPSGDRAAFGSFLGVAGSIGAPGFPNGLLGGRAGLSLQSATDGTSSTLLIGERPPPGSLQAGRWYTRAIVKEPFGGPDGSMGIPHPHISPSDVQCRRAASWFGPGRIENPCDRMHFWSLHTGGANFALADGSVRFITHDAAGLMPALATPAGGEDVTLP